MPCSCKLGRALPLYRDAPTPSARSTAPSHRSVIYTMLSQIPASISRRCTKADLSGSTLGHRTKQLRDRLACRRSNTITKRPSNPHPPQPYRAIPSHPPIRAHPNKQTTPSQAPSSPFPPGPHSAARASAPMQAHVVRPPFATGCGRALGLR